MSNEPRRNAPCPCGSGRKYKNCCQGQSTTFSAPTWTAIFIVAALAAGLFLLDRSFSRNDTAAADCPPGQVWSEAHGHCH